MTEKKVAIKKAPEAKKPVAKKPAVAKKVVTTATEPEINSGTVGFGAGDVYQALATTDKALSVAEIVKATKLSKDEILLAMGWLFKEGKIKDEGTKIALA